MRQPDNWYRRRLLIRLLAYVFGTIAAVMSGLTYGSVEFGIDSLLRLVIALPFLLSVVEEKQLGWSYGIWNKGRLATATFMLLVVAYFLAPSDLTLARAVAIIMTVYLAFAAFTVLRTLNSPVHFSRFKSLYDVLLTVRKNRHAADR